MISLNTKTINTWHHSAGYHQRGLLTPPAEFCGDPVSLHFVSTFLASNYL